MLHQVLVIAPMGICLIERQYEKLNIDPQLLGGFLSAVVPRMEELGMTKESLHDELIGSDELVLEIKNEQGFISVGIAKAGAPSEKIQEILEEISVLVFAQFNSYDPMQYSRIPEEIYEFIENHIDVLLARKGMPTTSMNREEHGLLPIINQVSTGRIKPKRAAKMMLEWMKSEDLDKDELENMKNSLMFVDNLLTGVNKGVLDDLQVVIRSTVQGVSKLTVRLDDALSF